jgi:hypothetical protein
MTMAPLRAHAREWSRAGLGGCRRNGQAGRHVVKEAEGASGDEPIKMSNRDAQTTATAEQESRQLREGRGCGEGEGQLHFKHQPARVCRRSLPRQRSPGYLDRGLDEAAISTRQLRTTGCGLQARAGRDRADKENGGGRCRSAVQDCRIAGCADSRGLGDWASDSQAGRQDKARPARPTRIARAQLWFSDRAYRALALVLAGALEHRAHRQHRA